MSVGKLVRIPSEEKISRIRVDRPQQALASSVIQFMHHGMTSERCVVRFDVQLEAIRQVIGS